MKLGYALAIAALALAPFAHAQHGHDATPQAAVPASHHGSGVVKSVDAAKGTVTIAHGAIETIKWPAMTMSFKAKDKKLLDSLKPGQKVDFQFTQEGKAYIVTQVK